MRLAVLYLDAPGRHIANIIDQDTNKTVGYIRSGSSVSAGSKYIFLLDGNYTARCASQDECLGFIKGVEAVLNHMLALTNRNIDRQYSTEATCESAPPVSNRG